MAGPPARRHLNETDDSLRWRNVLRRSGDVIVAAVDDVALERAVTLVQRSVWGPDGGIDWRKRSPIVDRTDCEISALAERLEDQQHRRILATVSPGDCVPFDARCHYVCFYEPGGAGAQQAPAAGEAAVRDHLQTWWRRRLEPNLLFVHGADLENDPGRELSRLEQFLAASSSGGAVDSIDPMHWLRSGALAGGGRPEDGSAGSTTLDTGRWHPVHSRLAKRPVSSLDAIAERRVNEARAAGLFDDLALAGKPIPDIDRQRRPGWWAEQFVARERNKVRAIEVREQIDAAMPGLWRSESAARFDAELRRINSLIDRYNSLTTVDTLRELDAAEAAVTWRRLRTGSSR